MTEAQAASKGALTRLRADGDAPLLVVGTMNFGERTKEPEARAILHRALDQGLTCFDTANIYNGGESEKILGRALDLKQSSKRAAVEIATKVGAWKKEGLGAARVKTSIDESLRRLGTDHVDVYYLHVPDHETGIRDTLLGMKEVLDAGKTRAWAVSNYASWQILEMMQIAREIGLAAPASAQLLYNCLHRELEIEYFQFRARFPMHLTVFNALAGGLLSGRHDLEQAGAEKPKVDAGSRLATNPLYVRRYVSDGMFGRAADVAKIAAEHNIGLIDLAYAFLGSRRAIDSILVGPASVAHLDAAISGIKTPLTEACVKAVDALERRWTGTDTHYVR